MPKITRTAVLKAAKARGLKSPSDRQLASLIQRMSGTLASNELSLRDINQAVVIANDLGDRPLASVLRQVQQIAQRGGRGERDPYQRTISTAQYSQVMRLLDSARGALRGKSAR